MGCVQAKPCRRRCGCRRCCCRYASSDDDEADDGVSSCRSGARVPDSRHAHSLTGSLVGTAELPSHALRLHYSSLSQRGHYPDSPDRENQDSLLVLTCLQSRPDLHFFAVFDGHGQFGAPCAAFARDKLADILSSDALFLSDPAEAFSAAFLATNEALHASGIDDTMSGTTAIAVLVSGDTLFVANVGDSRAVAGVWDGSAGQVVARDLSSDQTPFRRDEYERVRGCGARVLSVDQIEGIKDPDVQSWGDEESDDGDPPRLWVQDGMYPGTAFTRSVGDSMAERIGVIAVPEVMTVKITPDHRFFVVASDGVFEFLSSQTVVDMVAKFTDPRDACSEIAAESYRIWLEHENRTDDITIIVVHIKKLGNV